MAQEALRGRAGRPSGLPINLSFRDPPYIDISVSFLRLVGLFPAGPLYGLAVSYYYAYFLKALVPYYYRFFPKDPWTLPQVTLNGPKLGLAGGISRKGL